MTYAQALVSAQAGTTITRAAWAGIGHKIIPLVGNYETEYPWLWLNIPQPPKEDASPNDDARYAYVASAEDQAAEDWQEVI